MTGAKKYTDGLITRLEESIICVRACLCVCVCVGYDLETSTKRLGCCSAERKCIYYFKINFELGQYSGIKQA